MYLFVGLFKLPVVVLTALEKRITLRRDVFVYCQCHTLFVNSLEIANCVVWAGLSLFVPVHILLFVITSVWIVN